jgi:hypothetical protein
MRTGATFLKTCFCLLSVLSVAAAADRLSPPEYHHQLQELAGRIEQLGQHPEEVGRLEAELPDHISVAADSREYSLSYEWLKNDLKEFEKANIERRAELLQEIKTHLHVLDEQFAGFAGSAKGQQQSQLKLEEILSRHEFQRVHGPSAWDIWWEKVLRKLASFFTDRARRVSIDPVKVVIYLMVTVACIMFAIWIKRRFDIPKAGVAPREIVPFSPSARGWRTWLAEARKLAQQEDWRNSIHLAYWAGVAFLEEQGAWKPDRARTPREYLRLLKPLSSHHPALSALTGKFEIIWYGQRDAKAADFQEALGQLEKLGCR